MCSAIDEPTITLPAGTFLTIHVACQDRAGCPTFETWYAWKPKRWVKETKVWSYGVRSEELVSYKVR